MNKEYKIIPLSFNRRVLAASASVTREKNSIHAFTEVDIHEPRRQIKEHSERTGVKLSFTAYIVACLARTLKDFPQFNSFIKGKKLIVMNDLTISVLIEREINDELIPEPVGIKNAGSKSFYEIHREIRAAQSSEGNKLGSLSGSSWIRYMPGFLFKKFVRIADKNKKFAVRYGKISVTAAGMFSKQPLWFLPHGSGTVLLTIGSISQKVVEVNNQFVTREHLCLTVTFDHDIVDGAPASRFLDLLCRTIKSGDIIRRSQAS